MSKSKPRKKGMSQRSKSTKFITSIKDDLCLNNISPTTILSRIRLQPLNESLHILYSAVNDPVINKLILSCKFPRNYNIKSNFVYVETNYGLSYNTSFESIILNSFSEEISEFINLSEKFENKILLSELTEAEILLDEIFQKFGWSNWYISSIINLFHEKGEYKKFSDLRDSVTTYFKENKTISLSEAYATAPFVRCDKGVSYERYDFSIQHQTEEAKGNKDIIHFSHLYSPAKKYEKYSKLLQENSANNLIDRYIGFRRIVGSFLLNDISLAESENYINLMSKDITDKFLSNLSSIYSGEKLEADKYDEWLLDICDLYVKGDYYNVIVQSELLILENPTFVSINEIYIKSLIRCEKHSSLKNLIGSIYNELVDLYSSPDKKKYIKSLQKTYLRFYHCDWSVFLKLHCEKFSHGYDYSSIEKLYNYIDIIGSSLNPFSKIARERNLKQIGIHLSQRCLLTNPSLVDDLNLLDNLRSLKIQGDYHFSIGEFDTSEKLYNLLANSNDNLFANHAKSRIISCHLKNNNYESAINELAKIIVSGSDQTMFPIHDVYNVIYTEDKSDLDLDAFIRRAVVVDQYYKLTNSKESEIIGMLCEDILERMNISNANDIYIPDEELSIYFFSKVLTPQALEKADIFSTQEEVYIFRFYLVKDLISKTDDRTLNIELFNNIEKLIKEVCVIECGSGRIEADTSSIRNNLIDRIKNSFDDIKNSEKIDLSQSDYKEIVHAKGIYNIPSNKFVVDVLELYYQIRDEFTISQTFGLDYFLNMNIRHGGVVTLLWGPAKNQNLCYVKNDKGIFETNKYWFEQNLYMSSETRERLDDSLRNFSIKLDKKIAQIKNYIHINTGEFENDKKAFNYFTSLDFIHLLCEGINENSSVENFIDTVISDLIDITNESLEDLKIYIDKDFRKEMNEIFSQLKESLPRSKFGFDDLNRRIKLAQREINEKLDEMIQWMDWKNEASQGFYLGSAIEAASEMIENLHPGYSIKFSKSCSYDKLIKGELFRKFVMVFLILIDNAVVHSGNGNEIWIDISTDFIPDTRQVKITFSNRSQNNIHIDKINNVNLKINSTYLDDANKEQGSGLFKVKKVITNDMKCSNFVEIHVLNNIFFRIYLY